MLTSSSIVEVNFFGGFKRETKSVATRMTRKQHTRIVSVVAGLYCINGFQ